MGSHENTGNQSVDRKKILQREWKQTKKKKHIPLDTLLNPSKLDLAFLPGKNK